MYSPVIHVENLKKAYNEINAVNDVSFSIYKGDVYGYLGHNGAGKTTTMRLLLGLLKPDYGTIKVLSVSSGDGGNPSPSGEVRYRFS